MLTLAHLSDPHISTDPESLARLRRALDLLPSTTRPAALLVTGDLADHGTEAEYRSFRAALPEDLPLVSCPGNHDEIKAYRSVMLGDTSDAPVVRAHELAGLRLVSLDSTIPGKDEGLLAPDVLEAAAAALSGAEHAILALHHPPMPVGHPVMDDMLLTNPEALRALLNEFPQVRAICVGHVHTPLVASFAGIPVLGAPGITSTLRFEESADSFTDRGVPPGIALHSFDNGEIVRTTFHFA